MSLAFNVRRFEFGTCYTIGKIFFNGVMLCYTLEREVKERDRKPAIPLGTYKLIVDDSTRFKCPMPHILDVPGYEGIRIHKGNTDADTEGCILLGMTWAGTDFIGSSHTAFDNFFTLVQTLLSQGQELELQVSES